MKLLGNKSFFILSMCVNVFALACIIVLLVCYYVFLPHKCRGMINDMSNALNVSLVWSDKMRPLVTSRYIDVFKINERENENSFALIFKHGDCEYLFLSDGNDSMWFYSRSAKFAWHLNLGENNSLELSEECRKRFSCQTISLKTSNTETCLNHE